MRTPKLITLLLAALLFAPQVYARTGVTPGVTNDNGKVSASTLSGTVSMANGGLGVALTDPNADRILFWDDSAGNYAYLTAGSGLNITGTTLSTTGSGTVTDFSVVTANGVSASVATSTTTPAATFTLGAITPSSIVNSGTDSATSYSPTGGAVTGNKFWLPAANTPGISANGVEVVRFATVASGVNYLQFAPAAAGGQPVISAQGADGNVNITLTPKGAGGVTTSSNIQGNAITATQALNGTSLKVNGTKFTASGCSNSTTVGGSTAGKLTSGTTGTCAVTITMGNSQAATNGWSCHFNDETTPANLISQNGGSTTTATFTGTTVSGDVIDFACIGY